MDSTSTPEAAKNGPFGQTIAHGYLTLSLLPHLAGGLLPLVDGVAGGINYGSNKVRFPTPLPVGTRVPGAQHARRRRPTTPMGVMLTQKVEIEAEGVDKPVCVARSAVPAVLLTSGAASTWRSGAKRVFACAEEWPGLVRAARTGGGRDRGAAWVYADRYRRGGPRAGRRRGESSPTG